MKLIGRYTFEVLQRTLQGFFGFYKSQDTWILELFSLRVAITPHDRIEIYVLQDQSYIKIGKFDID